MIAPTEIILTPMLDCFNVVAILEWQNDGQEACDTWHCMHRLKGIEDLWEDDAIEHVNE